MVVGHFRAAGVYRGQTPHGIRRGAIQHALGYTRLDKRVMKKSGIKTGKNLDRYGDRKAHAGRKGGAHARKLPLAVRMRLPVRIPIQVLPGLNARLLHHDLVHPRVA